jgi:integrase
MRYPFTLVKIKSKVGTMWHARFWDESLQKYAHSHTTGILVEGKKEHRREAEEVARKLYEEFTEAKPTEPQPIETQPNSPTAQTTQDIPATTKNNSVADTPLIQYLSNFWTPNSEYAQFKRDVQKKPLTPYYIEMNHDDVRRHVEPFSGFSGVTVGSLSKAILKKWLIWLAGRKTQRRKKDGTLIEGDTLSGRRANTVLQAVRVAIRWAVDNEEIDTDPFRKLGEVSENIKEKGVLTFAERKKLTELPVSDCRTRLVMLLGSYCGLRRGEMRGLQWGDIADGLITVQHNFVNKEGVKQPKYNSTRRVPITADVQKILDMVQEYTFNISPESYVLESPLRPGKPLNNNFFREGVVRELESIGISAARQKERVLTCHSLRHTFVTLAQLSGIPDVEIRAMTGQKSAQVMGIYSHVPQVIDFDKARKKLEASGSVDDNNNERKSASG